MKEGDIPSDEVNQHYSNKGGHYESGQFWKTQRKAERLGFPPMRFVPEFTPPPAPQFVEMMPNQEYIIRRKMKRVPRTGK